MSRVGRKGYVIVKEQYNDEFLEEVRKELTVKPRQNPEYSMVEAKPYPVFREGPSRLYLPRYYGLQKFGPSSISEFPDLPAQERLVTNLVLRDYQQPIVDSAIGKLRDVGGGLLDLSTGAGKCLGRDTPIMMFDGSVKKVQHIQPGDLLMGDDSMPREVFSLGRGYDRMYMVTPSRGAQPYTTNSAHVLCVKNVCDQSASKTIDVSVQAYLSLPDEMRCNLKGFQVAVQFPRRCLRTGPWEFGQILSQGWPCENMHRLDEAIVNDREHRLGILGGLIDGAGCFDNSDGCFVVWIQAHLNRKITYLVKSLGFSVETSSDTDDTCRMKIYGEGLEDISCKKCRNDAFLSLPSRTKENNLLHDLDIKEIGQDEYFGFTISGNGRFLLGDFTVTHNTNIALYLACMLQTKTLIIVHKTFLMDQWRERIQQFIPQAQVGMIRGPTAAVDGKDIVIGMLQTLCGERYDVADFETFGLTIVDECLPFNQHVLTELGPRPIGQLYHSWSNKGVTPRILSYDEASGSMQFKPIIYAWRKKNPCLLSIQYGMDRLECTSNHPILTTAGYKAAEKLSTTDMLKAYNAEGQITAPVDSIICVSNSSPSNEVFDIEVEDNHNFVACSTSGSRGVIVHNCHHISAETFSRVLPKLNTRFNLGLSATMQRTDGLSKVFKWYLGDVACKWERKGTHDVIVKHISFHSEDEQYSKEKRNYRGALMLPLMINQIADFLPRNRLILHEIMQYVQEEGRQVMVLSDRIAHLTTLKEMLDSSGGRRTTSGSDKLITSGFYTGGGPTGKKKQRQLKESESKDVIFASYMMAKEGLDIGSLNTLVLATPTGDVVQAAGRILRKQHAVNPLIIDFVDNFSVFASQAQKRAKFYRKAKYHLHYTHWKEGETDAVLDIASSDMAEESDFGKGTAPHDPQVQATHTKEVEFLSDSD